MKKVPFARHPFLCVAVLVFGFGQLAQAEPRELIFNGDFAKEYRQFGWSEYNYAKVGSIRGSAPGSKDGAFISCVPSSASPGKELGDFAGVAQSILPCPSPGSRLKLSANVKCDVKAGGRDGEVLIEFTDAAGNRDAGTKLLFNENIFTEKSTEFNVPSSAKWCRVWIRKYGPGKMDVDYLSLVATEDDTPGQIVSLSSKGPFADKVVLSWNAVEGAKGYRIIRAEGNEEYIAGNVGPDLLTFTDYQVRPESTYSYDVRAVGNYGLSPSKRLNAVRTNSHRSSPGKTTYYIDARAGDDRNAGTSPGGAWKTFERINELKLAAGDQVLLKKGETWNEPLHLRGSGTEESPIRVGAYGTGKKRPFINPLGLPLDTSGLSYFGNHAEMAGVRLRDGSYWEFRDLEVSNRHPYFRGWSRSGVRVDNTLDGPLTTLKHIYFDNLYIHDVWGAQCRYSRGRSAMGILVYAASDRRAGIAKNYEDVRIQNCHLDNCVDSGISIYNVNHAVIENNLIERAGWTALVSHSCRFGVCQKNTFRKCGIYLTQQDNAIIDTYFMDDWLIQHNYVVDCEHFSGQGITWAHGNRNLVQYNYFRNLEGGGINMLTGCKDNTIRYNIFENVGLVDPHSEVIASRGPTVNTQFYNNTVYIGKGQDTPLWESFDTHRQNKGCSSGTRIWNNIFYVDGTSPGIQLASETGAVVDHNCYYGVDAHPSDKNAVTGDPLLANPAKQDFDPLRWTFSGNSYKLLSGSACIDAGLRIPDSGKRDFFGNDVPHSDGIDIGAAEHGAKPN